MMGNLHKVSDFVSIIAKSNPELPLGVALSGGADSSALLLASVNCWPGAVTALHIHHGLQAAAHDFEQHCVRLCQQLGVALVVDYVNAKNVNGESPEDAARKARYQALANLAKIHKLKSVLLGQHADDQIETVMLALSRGSGLPGLAAMPEKFERHSVNFYRPFLRTSGIAIRHWLDEKHIAYITDPTNSDVRFTRNKIRLQLMPALEIAFPNFRETFSRSAKHAAQAQILLTEVAQQDLEFVGKMPVIAVLQGLSKARQANVLRYWLLKTHQARPSTAQLEQLLIQVHACTTRGHRIQLKIATGQVTRTGAVLTYI